MLAVSFVARPVLALVLAAVEPAASDGELDRAVADVIEAERLAGEYEDRGESTLRAVLERLHELAPTVAGSEAAREAQRLGKVSHAQVLLRLGREAEAAEVLDDAIRTARGPVDGGGHGAAVQALARERYAALSALPTATLDVRCHVPCAVYLNEAVTAQPQPGLIPGSYRLWIEPREVGDGARSITTVELRPGETTEVSFGERTPPPAAVEPMPAEIEPGPRAPAGPVPAAAPAPVGLPPPTGPRRDRILPRWVSGLLTGLGLATIGAGVGLLVIDGRCSGADKNINTCPRVFETTAGGAAMAGVGAAAVVVSVPILIADERRSRRGPAAAPR